jgi:hypothetical protein
LLIWEEMTIRLRFWCLTAWSTSWPINLDHFQNVSVKWVTTARPFAVNAAMILALRLDSLDLKHLFWENSRENVFGSYPLKIRDHLWHFANDAPLLFHVFHVLRFINVSLRFPQIKDRLWRVSIRYTDLGAFLWILSRLGSLIWGLKTKR